MLLHPIQSSVLKSVGYDAAQKILELEFHEGGTYDYYNLSPGTYKRFMEAESKGRFFVKKIKGKYRELKVG